MSWASDTKFRFQLFFCILALLCPAFAIGMFPGVMQQRDSNTWPSVPGTVRGAVVQAYRDKDDFKYYGEVTYDYSVNGKAYQSQRLDLGPSMKRSSEYQAGQDVAAYRPGQPVDVFYNP